MAERSYYLEKAKLEKEGLDPVSKVIFFPNLFLHLFSGEGLRAITCLFSLFFFFFSLGKALSHFSFLSLILSVLIWMMPCMLLSPLVAAVHGADIF